MFIKAAKMRVKVLVSLQAALYGLRGRGRWGQQRLPSVLTLPALALRGCKAAPRQATGFSLHCRRLEASVAFEAPMLLSNVVCTTRTWSTTTTAKPWLQYFANRASASSTSSSRRRRAVAWKGSSLVLPPLLQRPIFRKAIIHIMTPTKLPMRRLANSRLPFQDLQQIRQFVISW